MPRYNPLNTKERVDVGNRVLVIKTQAADLRVKKIITLNHIFETIILDRFFVDSDNPLSLKTNRSFIQPLGAHRSVRVARAKNSLLPITI